MFWDSSKAWLDVFSQFWHGQATCRTVGDALEDMRKAKASALNQKRELASKIKAIMLGERDETAKKHAAKQAQSLNKSITSRLLSINKVEASLLRLKNHKGPFWQVSSANFSAMYCSDRLWIVQTPEIGVKLVESSSHIIYLKWVERWSSCAAWKLWTARLQTYS